MLHPEHPAGGHRQEYQVIQADGPQGRHWHIEASRRPMRGPMAGLPDALHQEPARMVVNLRCPRKPAGQEQARQIANQHQPAQRHGEQVGGRADGRENVKIEGHQRNRTEPGHQRNEECVPEKAPGDAQALLPERPHRRRGGARVRRDWAVGENPLPERAQFEGQPRIELKEILCATFESRHEQNDAKDDDK